MSLWNSTDTQTSQPKFIGVGQIRGVTVTSGGTSYTPTNGTAAATVAAPPIGGVQATANVTIVAGVITAVTVTNAGAGYITDPAVTYAVGGSGAVLASKIRGGAEISSVNPNVNDSIVFVDNTEAANPSNRAKGIKIPGWTKYVEYVDAQGTPRYKVECLIPVNAIVGSTGDDTDDTIVGDATFAILTQPASVSVTAPAASSFTVAATGATSYQWQLRAAAGGQYSNITNGGVYSTATTATLNISNSTGLTGNKYRCIVANTTAGASATSTGATLTVA